MRLLEGGAPLNADKFYVYDFKNMLLVYSWARLVLYSATFIAATLIQLLQSDFLCPEFWQPVNVIIFTVFLSHIIFLEFVESEKLGKQVLILVMFLDYLVVAYFLILIGSSNAIHLFAFLLLISASGTFFGFSANFKFTFFGLALFNLIYALNNQFYAESLHTTFFLQNISALSVSGLSGFFGEQMQDVSENIETQKEEIKTLTDINSLIVDNIPSGIFVISNDFRILRANRGAAKIFSDLSLEGRTLGEVSLDLYAAIQSYSQHLHGNNYSRFEIQYLSQNKEKMTIEVMLSKIKKKGERQDEYICLLQNLTEIKNLESLMRQKEKMAAVGQLAAGIAHEIRNPLASISGSVQLLQGNLAEISPESQKLLAIMIKEIDRLNKLIAEFLDFVRPEVHVEDPININTLVKEVLEIVRLNKAFANKIEQKVELRTHALVRGHYDKLKQAILNIVINAYQAMSDTLRPEIYVQSYDVEGKVVLVIQDNGIGMSAETARRAFEPFHTTKPKGTGLGLAITHKIIESHQAQIQIESELGLGTKFIIMFPAGHLPEANKMSFKKHA
ncbi:MAG: hypothetical protein A2Z20_11410 [Bdellovibrionales bacterium RBG_16_40_8]|nr:MAG: hypothetical protein A2Z20_11410 [Bdellovibrionales bacterium RBG_16_40_8]